MTTHTRQESHQSGPDTVRDTIRGTNSDARIESWLTSGGIVLASSARAARALASNYHQNRRAEGLLAWPTPLIFDWETWLKETWLTEAHPSTAAAMLLSPLQERSLWAKVIRNRPILEGISQIDRLAASAQYAYKLLASYAPVQLANPRARTTWPSETEPLSQWIADFESLCRRESCISPSRLPQLLAESLQNTPEFSRPSLLLAGFDRILPSQQTLLEAWGRWQQDSEAPIAATAHFHTAHDSDEELTACLQWLYAQRRANPSAKLMLIVPNLSARRGELERALLNRELTQQLAIPDQPPANSPSLLDFEFSLGVPLLHTSLVRSALYLLRWLYQPLEESELDWLLLSTHCAPPPKPSGNPSPKPSSPSAKTAANNPTGRFLSFWAPSF